MGKKTKFSFFSVWAPIALFAFLLSCGTVARTSPNVGVYKGEPLIYPHPCKKVRETCKEVLADQGYMVVAEDGNKIRSIRHATFWKPKASDMIITLTAIQPNSTRIDIVSQTDFEPLEFGMQDIYLKDFLKALRKKLLP